MGVLNCWGNVRSKQTQIQCFFPSDLDIVLDQFYGEVKKRSWQDFQPNP